MTHKESQDSDLIGMKYEKKEDEEQSTSRNVKYSECISSSETFKTYIRLIQCTSVACSSLTFFFHRDS